MSDMMELEATEVQRVEPTAMEAIQRAEANMAVETAKRYPREVAKAVKNATQLATYSAEVAEACNYCVPRAGRMIEGPTIRLAEIIATQYGNLRVQTIVKEVTESAVVVCAMGHDLESNVAISVDIRRRIVDKRGRRYNDDMITMTCNAAASIAYRNVVFRLVPHTIWKVVYDAAIKKTRDGDAPIETRRTRALEWFANRGVAPEQIYRKLGIFKKEDITKDHLVLLQGMRNAILDGEMTVATAFGQSGDEDEIDKPTEKREAPTSPPPPPPPAKKKEAKVEEPPEPVEPEPPAPEPEEDWPSIPEPPPKEPVSIGDGPMPKAGEPEYDAVWKALVATRKKMDDKQWADARAKFDIHRVKRGIPFDRMGELLDECERILGGPVGSDDESVD